MPTDFQTELVNHRFFHVWIFLSIILLTMHFNVVTIAIGADTETQLFRQVPVWLKLLNLLWFLGSATWLIFALAGQFCFDASYKMCDPCAQSVGGVDRANKCRKCLGDFFNHRRFLRVRESDGASDISVRFLVALGLLLPFNCIWFYFYTASPVLTDNCVLYKLGANGTIMEYLPDVGDWAIASIEGSGKDAIPAQPDCMTVVGALAEKWGSSDGDYYDELYDLLLHAFACFIGMFVHTYHGITTEAGGFAEDVVDLYDLYTMSFLNLSLMREGNLQFYTSGFNTSIFLTIMFSYGSLLLRFYITKCKCKNTVQNIIGLLLSVMHEVMFFFLRFHAWWVYAVPVSIFLLKNIGCGCVDLVELVTLITESCRKPALPSSDKASEPENLDIRV